MVYDSADGYVLYYDSGLDAPGGIAPSQTWSFLHGVWTQVHPAHAPPDGFGAYLTYDSTDGYVLLVGMHYTTQTWKFAGGDWTNISSSAQMEPTIWGAGGIADDPSDGYVVLFGTDNVHYGINQTWTFARGDWTNRTGAGVQGIGKYGMMAWDPSLREVVFLQETAPILVSNTTGVFCHATWYYRSGVWALSGLPSPCVLPGSAMAFYADGSEMVMQGPWATGSLANDTSLLTSSGWQPHPFLSSEATQWPNRMPDSMTYDPADHEIVLYGGLIYPQAGHDLLFSQNTWTYANGTWHLTPPLSGSGSALNPAYAWGAGIAVVGIASVAVIGWRLRARRLPPPSP
jgi:hypothetical protein